MSYTLSPPIPHPKLEGSNESLPVGEHIVTHDLMSNEWFTKDIKDNVRWADDEFIMPPSSELSPNLLKLRGADKPISPGSTSIKKGKTVWPNRKGEGILIVSKSPTVNEVFGSSTLEDGKLTFAVQTDTQLPSITLSHKKVVSKDRDDPLQVHRIILHGNTAMKAVSYHTPSSLRSDETLGFTMPPSYAKAASEGRVVGVTVSFGKSGGRERYGNCVTTILDTVQDNALNDKDRWTDTKDLISTVGPNANIESLSGFDRAVFYLYNLKNCTFTFLREIQPVDLGMIANFDVLYPDWVALMTLCIKHQPFWFYRLQPKFNQTTGNHFGNYQTAPESPPVPFWLITKAKITVVKEGLANIQPLEWATVVNNKRDQDHRDYRFPHPKYTVLVHELAMVREKACEYTMSSSMFDNTKLYNVTISPILPDADLPLWWRIDIEIMADARSSKVLPQEGCGVVIKFDTKAGREMTVKGRIVDELDKPENIDLVVYCNLSQRDAKIMRDTVRRDTNKLACQSVIKVFTDYTSIDRQFIGFRGVAADVSEEALEVRGNRPDPRHFLFGFEERFADKPLDVNTVKNKLAEFHRLHNLPTRGGIFVEICSYLGFPDLTATQRATVLTAIRGGKLTVVHGPPGSGKSKTLACIAFVEHFVFDKKVALCAPLPTTVDTVLGIIMDVYDSFQKAHPRVPFWRIVKFLTLSGARIGKGVLASVSELDSLEEEPVVTLDTIALRQRELWQSDPRFAGVSFHETKKAYAKGFHPEELVSPRVRSACKDWLAGVEAAVNGQLFGNLKKRFQSADEFIGAIILESYCQLLVGTCNSMSRLLDEQSYDADVVIIDEAAQAVMGELTVPFHAFSRSLTKAIVFGDHKQFQGSLAADMSNECGPVAKQSIFQNMEEDIANAYLPLETQFRSHSGIYYWANMNFFEGKILPGPNSDVVSPFDRRVGNWISGQVGHVRERRTDVPWAGQPLWPTDEKLWPRVIAVDINAPSEFHQGTLSPFNPAEIEFAEFVKMGLVEAGIHELDVHTISPYAGQVQAAAEAYGGPCYTVAESRGSECKVGISSFTQNDPTNIASTGLSNQRELLNVWFTRQQRFHFVLGPFRARHEHRNELRIANQKNKDLISWLEYICGPPGRGAVLLDTTDFIGWTGFSNGQRSFPSFPALRTNPAGHRRGFFPPVNRYGRLK